MRGTDLVSVPQICAEHTVCDVPADEARVSHADCVELDELIDIVAKAQDPDGYICTQIQLNPGKERWQYRHHHKLYNMGHLLTAASVHHRVTGKGNFLSVARKLADYLYEHRCEEAICEYPALDDGPVAVGHTI